MTGFYRLDAEREALVRQLDGCNFDFKVVKSAQFLKSKVDLFSQHIRGVSTLLLCINYLLELL